MYLLHRKKYGIYDNIGLFHSYSDVTAATRIQSVSRSDGGDNSKALNIHVKPQSLQIT